LDDRFFTSSFEETVKLDFNSVAMGSRYLAEESP
jgi:hypothetical protein